MLEFHSVTPERWPDLQDLFGPQGASSGCWCMWWRLRQSEFGAMTNRERKGAMKRIIDSGEVPGILAYLDGNPAGWCSIAPREGFGRLERSPPLKRVDEEPVWSIVCFYVDKAHRGKGIMEGLLRAAVGYARQHGALIVEGYPVEPGKAFKASDSYTGLVSTFRKAGFHEVLRRSERRPIMRFYNRR